MNLHTHTHTQPTGIQTRFWVGAKMPPAMQSALSWSNVPKTDKKEEYLELLQEFLTLFTVNFYLSFFEISLKVRNHSFHANESETVWH